MPRIESHKLRALAEAADGVRGNRVFLVHRAATDTFDIVAVVDNATDTVILECRTMNTMPNRPEVEKVDFKVRGKPPKELKGDKFDAVFWTESAVEKFVLPYYARLFGPESGTRINALLADFNQTDVAGVVHLPKSDSDTVKKMLPRALWEQLSEEAKVDPDPIHVLTDIVEEGTFIPLTVLQYGEIAALVPAR